MGIEIFESPDLGGKVDWTRFLSGIDVVVHLAARVHLMRDNATDPLQEYRKVNTQGTANLARQSAEMGVKRMVFLSTVKVNGERTRGRPFSESDPVNPEDPYAVSKAEAEHLLAAEAGQFGMGFVAIRSPLVYGPGVKGNLLNLMRVIKMGLPLPLGGIENLRSMISLDNLSEVLWLAASRDECLNKTFLVSDGRDISTASLVTLIAEAMGRRPRVLYWPSQVLQLTGRLVPFMKPKIEKLSGSLVVDSTAFIQTMNWIPPQSIEDGIRDMVKCFLDRTGP
jgi:UDP-glucose 4-epimerase